MNDFLIDDALGFLRKNRPFDPIILDQERGRNFEYVNVHTITVDCSVASDLKWEAEEKKVKKILKTKKYLFWDLDFGWHHLQIQGPFQMILSSFLTAVETFLAKLYHPYQKETFGVNFYRGSLCFPLPLNQEDLSDWIKMFPSLPEARAFYEMNLLSECLHALAAILPHDLLSFAFFDKISFSIALLVHLLSKEIFPHLLIITCKKNFPLSSLFWENGFFRKHSRKEPAKVGLVIPLMQNICSHGIEQIKIVIEVLRKKKIEYRLISEAYLNESWDQLDDLILLSDLLSSQGERKVRGFIAAGGRLIVKGTSLNTRKELSWEEYQKQKCRGRGI